MLSFNHLHETRLHRTLLSVLEAKSPASSLASLMGIVPFTEVEVASPPILDSTLSGQVGRGTASPLTSHRFGNYCLSIKLVGFALSTLRHFLGRPNPRIAGVTGNDRRSPPLAV